MLARRRERGPRNIPMIRGRVVDPEILGVRSHAADHVQLALDRGHGVRCPRCRQIRNPGPCARPRVVGPGAIGDLREQEICVAAGNIDPVVSGCRSKVVDRLGQRRQLLPAVPGGVEGLEGRRGSPLAGTLDRRVIGDAQTRAVVEGNALAAPDVLSAAVAPAMS